MSAQDRRITPKPAQRLRAIKRILVMLKSAEKKAWDLHATPAANLIADCVKEVRKVFS